MRLAALDLGSNSFNLLVVEVRADGSFEPIVREKVVLRLGEVVAGDGMIDDANAQRAVDSVVQLLAIAGAAGAADVVAVATSALRSAVNGDDVVDRIEAAANIRVRVVSGEEEAGLTFEAIRASVLIDPGPALALDLGGGSLEIMVGDRTGLAWSRSVELGASRLTGELASNDPLSAGDVRRIRRRVEETLDPLAAEVAAFRPTMLIGSSGTICSLARLSLAQQRDETPATLHQATVRMKHLVRLQDLLLDRPEIERARLPGLDARRAATIPAGALVLTTAMEVFGFEEMTVSEWALREGIVLEGVRHLEPSERTADPRAIRASSVLSLCRRCGWHEPHARQVSGLAVALFDGLAAVHGLGTEDRELLEHAGLLHDIGEHVAVEGHERHSAYLVQNGRLRGFAPEEIAVLASVCRFHRRGTPKPAYEPFAQLGADGQERVTKLTSLLRVADALDRSHAALVELVEVDVDGDGVRLVVRANADLAVEMWGMERKQELFERTFNRTLTVDVQPAQRRRATPKRIAS